MISMKAAVLRESGKPMTIEDLNISAPKPGEVLVRMKAAGVCHSDLHVIKGELPQRMPIVLGHEGAGIIEAVGQGVSTVAVGSPVALIWVPGCGECYYCEVDQAHLCDKGDPMAKDSRLSLGEERVNHFLSTSAFAEYVVVPESGVVPLPDDISLETAALMSCGVVTGIGAAMNAAKVTPGSSVAVFGCGGVGLNIIQGARLSGAERIIAIDRVADKFPLAEQLGATDTIAATEDVDIVSALRDLTDGRGVDFSFDAVGHVEVIKSAIAGTRKGGTICVVGLPPVDQKISLRGISLVLQEKTLMGSFYGSASPAAHLPKLFDLYRSGDLILDPLLSHTFKLAEINEAFGALDRGELNRALIMFGEVE